LKKFAALVLAMGILAYWVLKPAGNTGSSIESSGLARAPGQTEATGPARAEVPALQSVPVVKEAAKEPAEDPTEDPAAKPGPELTAQLEATRKALPTFDSVRGLKEEEVAHRAPPAVIEAGAALGDLEEYLERRPDEYKGATRFYAECALNEKLLPAARALCLSSLRKKPDQWAKGVKEAIGSMPAEISELAAEL